MSENLETFSQLNQEAKNEAVLDFASFYFRLYQQNSLEIITPYDSDEVMNDINYDLLHLENEDAKDIIKNSAKESYHQYDNLLNKINQKFFANGNVEIPWQQWYAKKYEKLGRG